MLKKKEQTEGCPESCGASCCRYVVKKISAPRTKVDFDELYWFLCHEKMVVFIERRKWYLLFDSPCKYLDADSLCRIYHERPLLCREHSEKNCEFTGEVDYQLYMRTPDDLKAYMKKRSLKLRMAWHGEG